MGPKAHELGVVLDGLWNQTATALLFFARPGSCYGGAGQIDGGIQLKEGCRPAPLIIL